ncbi:CIC11C00000000582 [Sungouiella intermedia]|uniref:CIC11C00000000582 n=1 Tax=Sungouiella intermedia TaxID=45354 RepID=A0A1L0DHA1_9ASCO|nr:CIC11C00000000582 [[Candida] intermedia]
MNYVIVNSNKTVVSAIQMAVDAIPALNASVSVVHAALGPFLRSYVDAGPSAIVSPANSLAYMGGGFDKAILLELTGDRFPNFNYKTLERCIQRNAHHHRGYIVPATVHDVDLPKVYGEAQMDFASTLAYTKNITTLLQVPTMVVPEKTTSQVVFDTMWSVLVESGRKTDKVRTLILPALGAGYGGVEPEVVGQIMAGAIALFNMDIPPLARSLAILLFTRKDHRKLGLPEDIAELEYYMDRDKYMDHMDSSKDKWPLPWSQLTEIMKI